MDERQAVKEPESSEFRQDFEQPQRPERISLGHNYATQTCFSKAANGFVSGTILGATMSGVSGMARATQLQIRFPAAVQSVVGATIVGGVAFGSALGAYQGVDDIMNPMMAGALVGALSEIPVYLRSKVVTKAELVLTEQGMHVVRPRPRFLTNAFGGAFLCGLFYLVGDAIRPAPESRPQSIPQPPQGTIQDGREGQELDTWNSSEDHENNGEWVFNESPNEEVLEREDSSWSTK
ncbi:uncharacterized protein [Physcomitrium patens]|uniref:Uncharacterized protein n=1 Tax=Physcomitrium patens TaxID=3218 RepID=A0A7I4AB81_PHYPA